MVAQVDKIYRKYGFGRTLRRLVSYVFFEGRAHTTKGQWINPFVLTFLKLLSFVPTKERHQSPIFITGMGRSGTTILGNILSLHPQLGYLNEPKAMWKIIDARTDVLGDYIVQGGRYILNADNLSTQSRLKAKRLYHHYVAIVGAKRVLDKYPEMIFRIEYLLEIFPQAKFLFITRNGVDACGSITNWNQKNQLAVSSNLENWWGRNDLKWQYLCEQLLSKKAFADVIENENLEQLDDINRAALEWIVTMQHGNRQALLHPNSILKIRYEDLVADPAITIKRISNFCQLPANEDVVSYAISCLNESSAYSAPILRPAIAKIFSQTLLETGYQVPVSLR